MSPEIHPCAAVGFERATDAYERGRPDYPADAIAHLVERLEIVPGRRVLDLAAGTGKLTRSIVGTGADVVAVEPVAAMRGALVASLPSVRALAGTAEAIPVRDGSIDAATSAQAFHWFDAPAAIEELHRVLRPEGRLGLVWNVRDDADPVQARLTQIMAPYRGDAPAHDAQRWREAFAASERFTPLERTSFRHAQRLDRDGVVDRVLSVSFIATLDEDERREVAREVGALVRPGATTILPYRTDVWTSRRR